MKTKPISNNNSAKSCWSGRVWMWLHWRKRICAVAGKWCTRTCPGRTMPVWANWQPIVWSSNANSAMAAPKSVHPITWKAMTPSSGFISFYDSWPRRCYRLASQSWIRSHWRWLRNTAATSGASDCSPALAWPFSRRSPDCWSITHRAGSATPTIRPRSTPTTFCWSFRRSPSFWCQSAKNCRPTTYSGICST